MEKRLQSSNRICHKRINIKNPTVDKVQSVLWAILVFLAFSLPVYIQAVKTVILIVLLLISLYKIVLREFVINYKLIRLAIIWCLFAVPVSLFGVINSNAGAFAFIKVELLYPIILFICVSTINNKKAMPYTIKAIMFSALFISLYSFAFLLYRNGLWFTSSFWIIDEVSDVGMHSGYTHITTTHLSMMMFIFPLLCAFSREDKKRLRIGNFFYYACVLLSLIAIILSGRRILWVAAAIGVLIMFVRLRISILKKVGIVAVLLIVLIAISPILSSRLGITFEGLIDRFNEAFSNYDEYGMENVRFIQMNKLLEGFRNNPIFGAGGGATLQGYCRNEASPWIFEASYHMILFNSGVFFFTIYILFFFYLALCVVRYSKYYYFVWPVFWALVCILIGNATNPYFSGSFDFLLFIFIPILFANNKNQCVAPRRIKKVVIKRIKKNSVLKESVC